MVKEKVMSQELLNRVELFFDQRCSDFLVSKKSVCVDFKDLASFDFELANLLIDDFDFTLSAFKLGAKQLKGCKEEVFIFFKNIVGREIELKDIRSEHVDKVLSCQVQVFQKGEILPEVVSCKFECPVCGNVFSMNFTESLFIKQPTMCGCGRKGKFTKVKGSDVMIDVQNIVVQEVQSNIVLNTQPKNFNALLFQDLTSPFNDMRLGINSRVVLHAVLRAIPVRSNTGEEKKRRELVLEVIGVDYLDNNLFDVTISEEDVKLIRAVASRNDLYDFLVSQFCSSILGLETVKLGLIHALFGGETIFNDEGYKEKHGHIHTLLVGDPGGGKSQLLKFFEKCCFKSAKATGSNTSGVGLTSSVEQNKFLGGWILVPGVLPMASGGFALIDEFDKIPHQDHTSLNEGLSEQEINVNKGSIRTKLNTDCTAVVACNPKFGMFDSHEPYIKQFDIDISLLNRFVLIFAIKPDPKNKKDRWNKGLDVHMKVKSCVSDDLVLDGLFWKKYSLYARKNFHPCLSNGVRAYLFEKLVLFDATFSGLNVPDIGNRFLDGMVQLAKASAKIRLSDVVEVADVDRALDIFVYSFKQIAVDESGNMDSRVLVTGVSSNRVNKLHGAIKVLKEIEEGMVGKKVPISVEDWHNEYTKTYTGVDNIEFDKIIEQLSRTGEIITPRPGFWKICP